MSAGRKRKASFPSQQSPAKKAKLAEGLLDDPDIYKIHFQSGQIVRMALVNWVTFDSTEIPCDPGLNLIVGPNGSGKSSVVCAICLGLGGKPKSLGRGEKVVDFIKFGRKEARIEIELFNKDGQNDIVMRYITTKGSTWRLNGKKVNATAVVDFVKDKRNIKVDNLCQFLAQDRVSEFARLSPKALLIETEKAMEDARLYKWHAFLMEEGEDRDKSQNQIENLRQTLQQNQAEKSSLSKHMDQFETKKKMEIEIVNYKALLTWSKVTKKWKSFKRKEKQTKKLKMSFNNKKANVAPLRKEKTAWHKKLNRESNKFKTHQASVRKVDKRRTNADKTMKKFNDVISELEENISQCREEHKNRIRNIKKLTDAIAKFEQQRKDDFNENDIEEAKRERTQIQRGQLGELRKERKAVNNKLTRINQQVSNCAHNLDQIEQQLNNMKNISKRKDEHIFNSNKRKEKQFKTWVDNHRHEFQGQVYGPIVKEITVKNDQHANFLNNAIKPTTFYGYACESGADWQRLLRKSQDLHGQWTVFTLGNNNGRHIRRPMDPNALRACGIDGYLDEIFDAPDIIKQVLNDNEALHMRGYAMNEVDSRSLDGVLVTHKGQSGRLRSLMTPQTQYSIRESRYSQNVLRSMGSVKQFGSRGILQKTPDFSQQIHEKEEKAQQIRVQLDNIENEKKQSEYQRKQVLGNINKLQDKKKALDTKITAFNRLNMKIKKKKKDLQELQAENEQNNPEEMKEKYLAKIMKNNMQRIKLFEQLADDIELEKKLMMNFNSIKLSKRYFAEQHKHVENKIKKIQARNQRLRKELTACENEEKKLKKIYQNSIRSACEKFPRDNFVDEWTEEDKKLNEDDIQNKINNLAGRIKVLLINPERVRRYQTLEKTIENQINKLNKLEKKQNEKTDAIKQIENQWKPQLQQAVDKISEKFSEFFLQFNKAQGKVELVWRDDVTGDELKYSEWHIDILTKFRNDNLGKLTQAQSQAQSQTQSQRQRQSQIGWKRLTSSSQSGGEKSVSTMLYLLSLQQVTTVPFRVVDEINQGMDPINERRIMQILNYECTPKNHQTNKLPQYFVVTPKLLPRLTYSPCSSVYVIYNGPYQMPQQYWEMDKFLQSQKQINDMDEETDDDDEDEEDEEDDEDTD